MNVSANCQKKIKKQVMWTNFDENAPMWAKSQKDVNKRKKQTNFDEKAPMWEAQNVKKLLTLWFNNIAYGKKCLYA